MMTCALFSGPGYQFSFQRYHRPRGMFFLPVLVLLFTRLSFQEIMIKSLQETTLNKLLGEEVPKILTTSEAGMEMFSKWTEQALSSLMAAVAEEHIKSAAPSSAAENHQKCVKTATSIKRHARCVVKLLEAEITLKPKYIKFNEKKKRRKISRSKREVTKLVRKGKGKQNRKSWSSLYKAIIDKKRRMNKLQTKTILRSLNSGRILGKSAGTPQEMVMNIIRKGVDLGMRLSGKKMLSPSKPLKLASPRLLSIVPEEKEEGEELISPSLFSLHDQGAGIEKKTSLTNLLGKIDANAPSNFLEMITEVTGLSDVIEKAEEEANEKGAGTISNSKGKTINLFKENITSLYGENGYRTVKVLEKLHTSYTVDQTESLKTTGYMIMNNKQLELVYGKGAPFENAATLKMNLNLTKRVAKREIRMAIRHLATGRASFSRRQKDFVQTPIIGMTLVNTATSGNSLILSPVILSPLIQSPAIFGAVILSPWLFVPLILSPRAFSPLILSPFMFSPLILSPFLMNPAVLSPGIANPLVLSPVALTPLILSPQVMTPLILSPMALSPVVLSPLALSPFVLSPFVLCPVILSPSIVGGLVLSPYALSPIIGSPPIGGGILIASPSFLS